MRNASCVIFVPDDTARTGLSQPLMLTAVAGAPLLWYLGRSLLEQGVDRVFLVCHKQYLAAARACLSAEMTVSASSGEAAADLLHVFLSTDESEEDELPVITGPAVVLPGETAPAATACSLTVQREKLMQALDEDVPFDVFLRENGQVADRALGLHAVQGAEDLARLQKQLRGLTTERLLGAGVQIPDPERCYIEPTVRIGRGAVILPGAALRGSTTIGEGCTVGPGANLLDSRLGAHCTVTESTLVESTLGEGCTVGPYAVLRNAELGSRCTVGSFAEVERAVLQDGVQIPRLAYVGDAKLGRGSYIGAMSVTANFDRADCRETQVDEGAFIGAGVQLVAPVQVGRGAYIAAGSTVTEDVSAQALGVARSKQTAKKDWAARHKLGEQE